MKVWNYMAVMLTMMIFLLFINITPETQSVLSDTGIQINSTTGELIEGDVASSSWFSYLFNTDTGILLAVSIGGAIIVGFFTKQFDWKIVLLPFFLTFLLKFISFGKGIVDLADETWLKAVFATVFLPLTVMFIISLIEWFGGSPSD